MPVRAADDRTLFGMTLSAFTAQQAAIHMLDCPRTHAEGVGLFVTPNIQHVSDMRGNAELADAMIGADLAVCDGFPVYRYARLRGFALPGRVTGREVVDQMLAQPASLARHRIVFLVDTQETASAIAAWMAAHCPDAATEMVVPPFGFDRDPAYSQALAQRVAAFGTTLLFLCVGAPRSELFVRRYRAILPPCWALCIGQSFKIALGLTPPPPKLFVRLNLEWFWRVLLEPRRMARRYGPASFGFLAAVVGDLRRRELG